MTKKLSQSEFMDDLLVKFLLEETSREEAEIVERWIQASGENRQYFQQLGKVWNQSAMDPGNSPGVDAAWSRFKQRVGIDQTKPEERIKVPGVQMRGMRRFMGIAAALLLVALGVLWASRQGLLFSGVSLSTDRASLTDTLPDQTIVTLNKHSSIHYSGGQSADYRQVELRGEAFFTVRDKQKAPFVVRVGEVRITDIGTEFNVRETGQKIEVIVATGSVRVEAAGKSMLLTAGQRAEVSRKDGSIRKDVVQHKLYTYYQTHMFVCEHTPLRELTETLEEAYDTEILIRDPALEGLPITSTFSSEQPLDSILNILSQTFPEIRFSRQGEKIILTRR